MTAAMFPLLAAGLPANPSIGELIKFAGAGLAVVLLSLSLLAIFCSVAGYLFQRSSQKAMVHRKLGADDALPQETVAVIAAAVATVVAVPHRIVHIRGLTAEELGWSWGGRIQHHTSHKDTHRHQR